jgi:hypothetical protein
MLAARRRLDAASHFDLFPTLLEMMGFDPSATTARYGSSLLARGGPTTARAFTYGPVIGFVRDARWQPVPDDLRSRAAASSGLTVGSR